MDQELKDRLSAIEKLYRMGALSVKVGDIEVTFATLYEAPKKPQKPVKVRTKDGSLEVTLAPPEPTAGQLELDALDRVLDDTV